MEKNDEAPRGEGMTEQERAIDEWSAYTRQKPLCKRASGDGWLLHIFPRVVFLLVYIVVCFLAYTIAFRTFGLSDTVRWGTRIVLLIGFIIVARFLFDDD